MSEVPRGAVVEILDESGHESGIIVPTIVFINGVDLLDLGLGLIAADGVKVSPGSPQDPATVTITLLPSEIKIGQR